MKKRPHPALPGPAHFVTARTNKRVPVFRSDGCCRAFFAAVAEIKSRFPFELYAYVLLPDHFHLLLRPEDGDISKLMQKIKSLSARRIVETLKEEEHDEWLGLLMKSREGRKRHSYQVFQQSFRTLEIVTPKLVKQKIDYIHGNPLRAGLAKTPGQYPWSSWQAFQGDAVVPIPVDPVPL